MGSYHSIVHAGVTVVIITDIDCYENYECVDVVTTVTMNLKINS